MPDFKGVYLDHNATSPLKAEAREAMISALLLPGNASSVHRLGRESRKIIESARARVAALVNAGEKAVIVFTSGATEANNLVLKGSGCERVIVSAIEHPSVLVTGAEILPVLASGIIDLAALEGMLKGNDRSTLISVMLVNNETGVVQPVDEVAKLARKYGALVHTDAAQAAGKIKVDIQALGADYLTLSAHKMGGPQGAGALVMANCVTVSPLLTGGNQEKNMRAGTENLAAIAGFGAACDLAARDLERFQALGTLRDKIESKLKAIAPTVKVFGEGAPRVANTSMFALPGASSETQLIALDLAGVYVSNGSACSSGTVKASHVLKAMGVPEAEASCALRVSLGWNTTEDDVECFLARWAEMYERVKNRLSAA
jgi:cysteine desulfurase